MLPLEVKSPSNPPKGQRKRRGTKGGAASADPTKTADSTRTVTRSVDWAPKLTATQQLASYALEVLSATGLRRSTLGLLISDDRLEIWFYDRAGGIAAESISIKDDFVRFVELFVALSRATPEELGFEPCIFPATPFPTHANGAAVPSNSGATWEIIGERLNETRGLIGHGTAAWKVVNHAGSSTDEEPCAAKISWQEAGSRESEVSLLMDAAGIAGIPSLVDSADLAQLSDGVRGRLQPYLTPARQPCADNRILRLVVMRPVCVPLYLVEDPATLLVAFRSLVTSKSVLVDSTRACADFYLSLTQPITNFTQNEGSYIATSISKTSWWMLPIIVVVF